MAVEADMAVPKLMLKRQWVSQLLSNRHLTVEAVLVEEREGVVVVLTDRK